MPTNTGLFSFEAIPPHGDLLIRHRNFLGELTTFETGLVSDFAFRLEIRDPFDENLVAFSATGPHTGKYFRHSKFRIHLEEKPKDSANEFRFLQDSSFFMVRGLTPGPGTRVSFRSFNFPDRFLRHRDFQLFVEGQETPNLAADATFIRIPAPSIIDR